MHPLTIVWSEILLRLSRQPGTVLQIGSHDGKSHDPIYSFLKNGEWMGVLVEPVPWSFKKLVTAYDNSIRFIFLNRAIVASDSETQLPFYTLKPLDNPPVYWYDGLSSFDKSVLLWHKHSIPNIEDLIIEIEVKTCTIVRLIDEYDIRNIELLVIDSEGWDGKLVRSFPFERSHPAVILYENKHLSGEEKQLTYFFLRQAGYSLLDLSEDTCAIAPHVMRADEVRLLRQLLVRL